MKLPMHAIGPQPEPATIEPLPGQRQENAWRKTGTLFCWVHFFWVSRNSMAGANRFL